MLWELREEKKIRKIKPEVLSLTSIKNRYGRDPLPGLRILYSEGKVKNCKLLNDIGFFYEG